MRTTAVWTIPRSAVDVGGAAAVLGGKGGKEDQLDRLLLPCPARCDRRRRADQDLHPLQHRDVNYFQHVPYLDQQKKDNPSYKDLVPLEPVHLEPLGIYSKKVKDVHAVKNGGTVTLSNDPANEARGLKLLQQASLVTLKDGAGLDATPADVADNPKGLKFKTIAPANLPRTLDDADLAVINGNYAIEAKLSPAEDALVLESSQDNPYANLLVAKQSKVRDPRIRKLEQLLRSPEVKKLIQDKYRGSVIPAF